MPDNESELIARLAAGDKTAFDTIYYKYVAKLLGFCRKYLRSTEDIEEIVEDVFISLWQNRRNLRNADSVRPLLFISTRNRLLNALRARINSPIYEEYIELCHHHILASEPRPMEYSEFERLVMTSIRSLPPTQRRVIIMSRLEYLSTQEISQRLNLSPQTVRNALSQGLKQLHEKLGHISGMKTIITALAAGPAFYQFIHAIAN